MPKLTVEELTILEELLREEICKARRFGGSPSQKLLTFYAKVSDSLNPTNHVEV